MNFLSGHITIGRLNHLSCHESRSYSFRSPLTFFRRICMRAVRNAHFHAHVCLNLHSKHFWSHRYADSVGCFFLDMHGLIFYLSISPLAGSTRYLGPTEIVEANIEVSRASTPKHSTHEIVLFSKFARKIILFLKNSRDFVCARKTADDSCIKNFCKNFFFSNFLECTKNGRDFVCARKTAEDSCMKNFCKNFFYSNFSECTKNGRGFVCAR